MSTPVTCVRETRQEQPASNGGEKAPQKQRAAIVMSIAGQPAYWDEPYLSTEALADPNWDPGAAAFRVGGAIAASGLVVGGTIYLTGQTTPGLMVAGGFIGIGAAICPLVGLFLVVLAFAFDAVLQLGTSFFTGTKAMAIMTALVFMLRLPRLRIRDFFVSVPLRLFTALVVLYSITFLFFVDIYYLARMLNLMVWVLMLGLAILVAAVPRNFKQLRVICLAATLGGGIIGVYILVFGADSLVDKGRNLNRLNVGGLNENALAHVLGVGLFLSGIAWHGASLKTKILILFNDLMATIAIGLSASRAVWMAILVAVLAGVLFARRVKLKYRMLFLVVASLAGISGYMIVETVAPKRVDYLLERMSMMSTEHAGGRLEYIWPAYWDAFAENPLLGLGVGANAIIGLSAHNDILNTMGSSGLVGIILFTAMYILMMRDALRNTTPWLRMVSIAGLFFCFTYGMTHTSVLLKPFAAFVGVMACMTNLGMCPPGGSKGPLNAEPLPDNPAARNKYKPW